MFTPYQLRILPACRPATLARHRAEGWSKLRINSVSTPYQLRQKKFDKDSLNNSIKYQSLITQNLKLKT